MAVPGRNARAFRSFEVGLDVRLDGFLQFGERGGNIAVARLDLKDLGAHAAEVEIEADVVNGGILDDREVGFRFVFPVLSMSGTMPGRAKRTS